MLAEGHQFQGTTVIQVSLSGPLPSRFGMLWEQGAKFPSGCLKINPVIKPNPCILVIGEAALAADLITRFICTHLERNLAEQMVRKAKEIGSEV